MVNSSLKQEQRHYAETKTVSANSARTTGHPHAKIKKQSLDADPTPLKN